MNTKQRNEMIVQIAKRKAMHVNRTKRIDKYIRRQQRVTEDLFDERIDELYRTRNPNAVYTLTQMAAYIGCDESKVRRVEVNARNKLKRVSRLRALL